MFLIVNVSFSEVAKIEGNIKLAEISGGRAFSSKLGSERNVKLIFAS